MEQEFNLEEDIHMSKICEQYTKDGERILSNTPSIIFRQCLVDHFDINFKINDLLLTFQMTYGGDLIAYYWHMMLCCKNDCHFDYEYINFYVSRNMHCRGIYYHH